MGVQSHRSLQHRPLTVALSCPIAGPILRYFLPLAGVPIALAVDIRWDDDGRSRDAPVNSCPYQKFWLHDQSLRWRVIKVEDVTREPRNARYATTMDDEALCVSAEQPDNGQYGRVKRRRQRRSGGATFVMMMQAADVRDWTRETGVSLSSER